MFNWGFRRSRRNKGQGQSEYGSVMLLVSVIAIAALTTTGSAVAGFLGSVAGAINVGSNPCDLQACELGCFQAFQSGGGPAAEPSPAQIDAYLACTDTCTTSFNGSACETARAEEF